jgi:hypothetical protein
LWKAREPMSAKFPIFFAIAIAALALFGWFSYSSTSDSRLQVSGEILKVRSVELTPESTLVLLDFRIRNESDVNFLLKEDTILWTDAAGKEHEATHVTRPDLNRILQYSQQAVKFNEMFVIRDKLGGKAMIDRMTAGSISVPDAEFAKRKSVRLKLTDLDGLTFELQERKK